MHLLLVACILAHGANARWNEVNHCGESIYPDAGEGLDPLGRIVGGEETREYEFPYQVALYSPSWGVYCGGVLLNHRWVVTAAHCVYGENPASLRAQDVELIFGEFDLDQTGAKEKKRRVDKVIVHEDFGADLDKDIALLRVNRRVGFAQGRIQPICRPTPGEDYVNRTVIATGWGDLEYGALDYPRILQYAPLVIIPQQECIDVGLIYPITPAMVCASDGLSSDDRDTCQGDSGGPIAVKENGRFRLVGLTSWGHGCAAGTPGVYTRITEMLDWIDSKI